MHLWQRTKDLETAELLDQLPALQQLLFRVLGCQVIYIAQLIYDNWFVPHTMMTACLMQMMVASPCQFYVKFYQYIGYHHFGTSGIISMIFYSSNGGC